MTVTNIVSQRTMAIRISKWRPVITIASARCMTPSFCMNGHLSFYILVRVVYLSAVHAYFFVHVYVQTVPNVVCFTCNRLH